MIPSGFAGAIMHRVWRELRELACLAWLMLAALPLVWAALGCGPRVDNSQVKLPVPVESTTLGPGDRFTLEVVGEKDLPKE